MRISGLGTTLLEELTFLVLEVLPLETQPRKTNEAESFFHGMYKAFIPSKFPNARMKRTRTREK